MQTSQGIEALVFDLGGVVIDVDFDLALWKWSEISRLTVEEIRRRFVIDAEYERHERGEMGAFEYFQHLGRVLELDAGNEQIVLGWNAILAGEITETLDTIRAVGDHLPCFAFTNTNPTHQCIWERTCPRVVAAFDRIFVSSELGLRKPERAAFEAVADAIGTRPQAILFFDDSVENVNGARAAGFRAVQVRTPLDVERALLDIGAL